MPSSQRFEGGNFGESVRSAAPVAGAQRVGPLAVIPGLLRELGADPDQVLASVGLDAAAQRCGELDSIRCDGEAFARDCRPRKRSRRPESPASVIQL